MFQFYVALGALLAVLCLALAAFVFTFADARSNAPSASAGPRGLPQVPVRRRRIGFQHPS